MPENNSRFYRPPAAPISPNATHDLDLGRDYVPSAEERRVLLFAALLALLSVGAAVWGAAIW